MKMPHMPVTMRRQAQAALAQLEVALDFASWPWSRRISLWLDALVLIEEGEAP